MNIVFDMDNVLIKSSQIIISLYNLKYNRRIPSNLNVSWDFDELKLITKQDIKQWFESEDFFHMANLKIMDGMQDLVEELHSKNHKLYCCSCSSSEKATKLKKEFLKNNYPELFPIIIPIQPDGSLNKSLLDNKFDILIDDNVQSLNSANCKYKVLFSTTKYNMGCEDYTRVENPQELREVIYNLNILRNLGVF